MENIQRVGPVLSPRVSDALYSQLAVWVSRKAASDWALAHSQPKGDVFKILAGSANMSFTQWIIRDASGMALTDTAVRVAEAE